MAWVVPAQGREGDQRRRRSSRGGRALLPDAGGPSGARGGQIRRGQWRIGHGEGAFRPASSPGGGGRLCLPAGLDDGCKAGAGASAPDDDGSAGKAALSSSLSPAASVCRPSTASSHGGSPPHAMPPLFPSLSQAGCARGGWPRPMWSIAHAAALARGRAPRPCRGPRRPPGPWPLPRAPRPRHGPRRRSRWPPAAGVLACSLSPPAPRPSMALALAAGRRGPCPCSRSLPAPRTALARARGPCRPPWPLPVLTLPAALRPSTALARARGPCRPPRPSPSPALPPSAPLSQPSPLFFFFVVAELFWEKG